MMLTIALFIYALGVAFWLGAAWMSGDMGARFWECFAWALLWPAYIVACLDGTSAWAKGCRFYCLGSIGANGPRLYLALAPKETENP